MERCLESIYYIFRTLRSMMSASTAFSYGAEKRFVINNIEKCRKLSLAEAFRPSTHCHPLIHSSPACISTLTSTLSLSDLFSVFLCRDERPSYQRKRLIQVIHINDLYKFGHELREFII